MNFPFVQVAGDTLDMQVTVPDYPSTGGWTLKYRLTPRFATPTQAAIDITATANADGTYQLQKAPTDTMWVPGAYGWARWVEKSGARQTLTSSEDQGEVQVRQNPATTVQGYDSRSYERKLLEQVQSAMLALNSGVKSYTIGTRQMTYRDMPELVTEESRLKWLVANEEARQQMAAGQPNPRLVGIRFGRP